MPPPAQPIPEEDLELRLERRGNQVRAFVTLPGQGEIAFPPLQVDYPPTIRVGVAAVNAAQEPLTVRFEGLQIVKK